MAYVSTIISGAASLGVLIGLFSGIFFLILTALRWVSRVRAALYEEELHRQKKFLIDNSYLLGAGSNDFIESRKASNGLGSALAGSNSPEQPGGNVQSHVASAEDWNEGETEEKLPEKLETNADTVRVREFIEKMVEGLIGGPLDGTTVGQLSSHSAYENGLEIDSSNPSQTNLKRLIKRIVSEAMALPNIKEILCRPKTVKKSASEDFKNKSYEDILATAILNKVIDHFQKKKHRESDSTDGPFKRRAGSRKMRRNEDDDELRSNSDWSDTSRSDQLSLTIEEYIEEVTTAFEASDDEKGELSDYDSPPVRRIPFPESGRTVIDGSEDENSDLEEQSSVTELNASTNSWEENWLFQKKRLRSTPNAHHPVPVPMLVPNPSEDFRALVGGVDADDLSDMSDCSDSALEELITKDEELIMSSSKTELIHHSSDIVEEVKANGNQDTDTQIIVNETAKETQKEETEHPEKKENETKYASQVEEVCEVEEFPEEPKTNSLGPTSPEVQNDREFSIEDFNLTHQYESTNHQTSSDCNGSEESTESTIRCRIAEREKEKWNNPVPLPDNPYSLENIEKREQRNKMEYFRIGTYTGEHIDFPEDLFSDGLARRKSENLRFTRDYYVNASKNPSGMSPSASITQLSEGHEQELKERPTNKPTPKLRTTVKEDKGIERRPRSVIINRSEFRLPSVKELAKQFTMEEDSKHQSRPLSEETVASFESKHKTHSLPEKELEIDYSTTPISEIIQNLKQASEPPLEKPKHLKIMTEPQPPTRMEIRRRTNSNSSVKICTEKGTRNGEAIEAVRFNGKQVHSLTARSISKEFREGLKNSYQKSYLKLDKGGSGGESDQGDIISNNGKISPTPSIDLKNMKKFWEEIITANSNSTKEK